MNISDMFSESSRAVRQNTRARLFAEHRINSVYHTIAFALLGLVFWGADWAVDAASAKGTLLFRLAIVAILLLSALVKWLSRSSLINWLATYVSLAVSEVLLIALLNKLNGGLTAGAGQFLYFFLGSVLLSWHYSFKLTGPSCLALALIPSLAGALLSTGFPHVLYASILLPTFALTILTHLQIRPILVECVRLRKESESSVIFDPATGLLNKRGLEHSFQRLVKLGEAKPLQQFLLLIEIDGMDGIKQAYGEAAAQSIWSQMGQTIELAFRGRDITSSLEGEFACILLHLSREKAFDIAERFRGTVAGKEFACPGTSNGKLACTVSIGIVAADTRDSINGLLNVARVGINQAKALGGNQCACV